MWSLILLDRAPRMLLPFLAIKLASCTCQEPAGAWAKRLAAPLGAPRVGEPWGVCHGFPRICTEL